MTRQIQAVTPTIRPFPRSDMMKPMVLVAPKSFKFLSWRKKAFLAEVQKSVPWIAV